MGTGYGDRSVCLEVPERVAKVGILCCGSVAYCIAVIPVYISDAGESGLGVRLLYRDVIGGAVMQKEKAMYCEVCGDILRGQRKRFCSNVCRKQWTSDLVFGRCATDTEMSDRTKSKSARGSEISRIAEMGHRNGRSYGMEVVQEYIKEQSRQMRESMLHFYGLQNQKHAEKDVAVQEGGAEE